MTTDTYPLIHSQFRWLVPPEFNIAQVCCARWALLPDAALRAAVVSYYPGLDEGPDRYLNTTVYTYKNLQLDANRLANVLNAQGIKAGDRVAIVMPQRYETAVAYIALLQMGAVAMPLSMLFGPEALQYRLENSDAVAVVADSAALAGLREVRSQCPSLKTLLVVPSEFAEDLRQTIRLQNGELDYNAALQAGGANYETVKTKADDAAVLIYTSGTTGPAKGALIPHRALIGNLTGFVASQNWFGFDADKNTDTNAIFWSPADWAWTGGLMDALLPTLYFGRPIVAYNGRFDPVVALELMRETGVTHTFIFPTALKAMMKAVPGNPQATVREEFNLKLQAIMSAGEAVGGAVGAYCETQLGVRVNEMFGQTEINYVVGNCNRFWPAKPGSMGKAYPGHQVRVIDETGAECKVGEPGDVAVNRFDIHGHPDPVFFLGYWKNEVATKSKYTGDWCRTGDIAIRDVDGYLWYQGRSDDMFKAAGYRIGPGEVENCLVKHAAVANAAVVPKPDAARGAVVKAYVVLAPDYLLLRARKKSKIARFDAQLIAQLQQHVKGKLAPYEYPKEIEFVEALPMTTTGKVQRRILRLQEEERARTLATAKT